MTLAAMGLGSLFGAGVASASATNLTALGGGLLGGLTGAGAAETLKEFKPKEQKPPKMPGQTTAVPDVGYASEAERQRRRRHRGYGSTLVAPGGLGVATTYRKQILG